MKYEITLKVLDTEGMVIEENTFMVSSEKELNEIIRRYADKKAIMLSWKNIEPQKKLNFIFKKTRR